MAGEGEEGEEGEGGREGAGLLRRRCGRLHVVRLVVGSSWLLVDCSGLCIGWFPICLLHHKSTHASKNNVRRVYLYIHCRLLLVTGLIQGLAISQRCCTTE